MTNLRVLYAIALMAILLGTFAGCGSGPTMSMRTVAGDYVFEQDTTAGGTRAHVRRVLTLRRDGRWSETSRSELNGRRASVWSDSGSFSVHRERVVVLSMQTGITKFRLAGDTLWTDRSEEAAMDRRITGQESKPRETFLVRQR